MSELKECKPDYIYVTIPTEYLCIYYRILNLLSDYGIESIKDCKASCSDKNCSVIECFNMFNCAVACRKLGKTKEAALIIKYVEAKIKQLSKSDDDITFTFNLDKCGHHKAVASSSDSTTVKVDKKTLEAIEEFNRDMVLYCDNDNTDENCCCCHKHWFIPIFTPNTDNVYDRDLHMFQSEINRWFKERFDSLDLTGVDYDKIKELIEEYLKDNPCDCEGGGSGLTEDEIKKAVKDVLDNYEFPSVEVDEETIKKVVEEVLKDYPFSPGGDCDCTIDEEKVKEIVEKYLQDNPPSGNDGLTKEQVEKIVEEYLKQNPPKGTVDKETVKELVEEVIKETDFSKEIASAVEKWIKENNEYFKEVLQPTIADEVKKAIDEELPKAVKEAVDAAKEEILKELQEYLTANERVVANALARHEQAISELQV